MGTRRRARQLSVTGAGGASATPAVGTQAIADGRGNSVWHAVSVGLLGVAIVGAAMLPADAVALERGGGLLLLPLAVLAWGCGALAERWRTGGGVGLGMPREAMGWQRCAIVGLVVWMAISAAVVAGPGNARAAVNEWWWWVTAACLFFAARRVMVETRLMAALVAMVLAIAVGQGVYGLYQEWVSLPADRALFEQDPDMVLSASGIDAPEGSPLRALFRDRLYGGGPTGSFALTNSLAGYLLLGLVLGAGLVWRWCWVVCGERDGEGRERTGSSTVVSIGAVCLGTGLIGLALSYTSSRSAYVAAALGLSVVAVGVVLAQRRGAWAARVAAMSFLGTTVVGVGAVWLLVLQPGLWPRLPRSLEFRAQYWAATWDLLGDHPWVGAGPGNFQDRYLSYRLPEASESVADPHHWFVETWAAGGWPAGLLWGAAIVLGCWSVLRSGRKSSEASGVAEDGGDGRGLRRVLLLSGLATYVVLMGKWWFLFERDIFPVAVGGVLGVWVLVSVLRMFDAERGSGCVTLSAVVFAAVLAMTVHWWAAGGWTVPGMAVSWLVLAAGLGVGRTSGAGGREKEQGDEASGRLWISDRTSVALVGMICVGLWGAWWWTAWRPVTTAEGWMMQAERRAVQRGQQAEAVEFAERAVAADAWDPGLAMRAAELRLGSVLSIASLASSDSPSSRGARERAEWEGALAVALSRQQTSATMWGRAARQWLRLFQECGRRDDLEAASAAWQRAVELAPTEEQHVAQLAVVQAALGDWEAAEASWGRAVWLADQGGHADRQLDVVQVLVPVSEVEHGGGSAVRPTVRGLGTAEEIWDGLRAANRATP